MSVTLEPQSKTLQQRSTEATNKLKKLVGVDDLKILSAALAEVAAKEAEVNPQFAEKIKQTCSDFALNAKKSAATGKRSGIVQLVPTGTPTIGAASWTGELNPYRLYQLYGAEQFHLSLEQYSLSTLKEGLELVIAKHPGTKPKTKSKKSDIIDYMVEYVPQDL